MNLKQLVRDIADLAYALDNRIRVEIVHSVLDESGHELERIHRVCFVPAPRTKERNQ